MASSLRVFLMISTACMRRDSSSWMILSFIVGLPGIFRRASRESFTRSSGVMPFFSMASMVRRSVKTGGVSHVSGSN